MNKTCSLFLCAMVLLFTGQVLSGGLGLQKKTLATGNFPPLEDWSEESSEEDDVREFNDDLTTCESRILCLDALSRSLQTYFVAFGFSEHILEIILPPPQA